jgi:ABC-2 type transport system permease protein
MKRFWVTFRYTLTSLRGQILGWGLGLALYGMLIVSMYNTLLAQQDQFQQMIANYPEAFLAFFGGDANQMMTPAGFLGMYAFSMMPILIGIFAVLAGSGLIVSDEEHGRLDLIIAHPVGRSAFFLGRSSALFAAGFMIHFLGWLGFCLLLSRSNLEISWGQMALPFLSLLLQIWVYASLALMLSLFLPARSLAAMVSGAVIVASYFVSSLAFMHESLDTASKFLPYHYYQTVLTFSEVNLSWLLGLLGISLLMMSGAWLRFLRRDIRLSGEGSWHLPWMAKKHKLPETS